MGALKHVVLVCVLKHVLKHDNLDEEHKNDVNLKHCL